MNRQEEFKSELRALLNRFSAENGSNTPDYILADYLFLCLMNFDNAVIGRSIWWGDKDKTHGRSIFAPTITQHEPGALE